MGTAYLTERLDALRKTQHEDGGWGYSLTGRTSWLEPTVYAALALAGEPESDRAWKLVAGWQRPDGSWRTAADVNQASWASALAVTLAVSRGQGAGNAVSWLSAAFRAGGWSWGADGAAAVEPTMHSLIALQKVGGADEHVRQGGELLLASPVEPETAGLLLVGLQGSAQLGKLPELAAELAGETPSRLARAWIDIGLRLHGIAPPERPASPLPRNLSVLALEALGASDGNFRCFRIGGAA